MAQIELLCSAKFEGLRSDLKLTFIWKLLVCVCIDIDVRDGNFNDNVNDVNFNDVVSAVDDADVSVLLEVETAAFAFILGLKALFWNTDKVITYLNRCNTKSLKCLGQLFRFQWIEQN